jgi:hypothetical protein
VHRGRVRALASSSAIYQRSAVDPEGPVGRTHQGRVRALGELIGRPSAGLLTPRSHRAGFQPSAELWRAFSWASDSRPSSENPSVNPPNDSELWANSSANRHAASGLRRTLWPRSSSRPSSGRTRQRSVGALPPVPRDLEHNASRPRPSSGRTHRRSFPLPPGSEEPFGHDRGRVRALGELIGRPSAGLPTPRSHPAGFQPSAELWRAHRRTSSSLPSSVESI